MKITPGARVKDFALNEQSQTLEREIPCARKIGIEIGDSKTPGRFLPQSKVMLWDNEVNFSIRGVMPEEVDVVVDGDKIKHVCAGFEIHQYEKPEAGEDGGLEFEWVLPSIPPTNQFVATIRTKGLEFYYQPFETDEGDRPDNVKGSYAVYHATRANNFVGGKQYFTGKAFHIYRPEAVGANGERVWCELAIDTVAETLTVTVPQSFLDSAVYPVTIDPTFGYTTSGASTSTSTTSAICNTHSSTRHTATTGDTITSYSCILGTTALPVTRAFAQENITINTTGGIYTSATVSQALTNAVNYGIAIGRPSTGQIAIRFDTIGGTERSIDNAFDCPATWTNAGTGTTRFSTYATYTEGGGGGGLGIPIASYHYNHHLRH
jgi:hypothetical protein